ncbi:HPr kinase/phosphorylase [Sphingomicrobium astaxanthinifaciens]|uniref:HPr kinase/phosphorylase n=1 Tax=Sphingomicrobium astaxanthinifaciens TaxID=1227949 RepID=UPI001FCBFA28|nr:aldolase [Sphingomicrobium astaxanthinifaciens]MCJ7422199.1 aldolase [Sphingomicrobium astaxanthinifaciens]
MRNGSSDIVHATSVAIHGNAVLFLGASGSGKSDLALRLIDRGHQLIADDRTIVHLDHDALHASPPPTIAGKLEARGVGILDLPHVADVPVALAIGLDSPIERFPLDEKEMTLLGCRVPLLALDARAPSAPILVEQALRREVGQ